MGRLLKTDVVKSVRRFAALEEEWEELYQNSSCATAFQSWAWLYSWWESYGEGYELRLVTVRSDEGTLVGIMPLMLERRRGFGKLLFVGTGLTDHLDVLVRRGWEEEVSGTGVQALERLNCWQVADLQQLRPEAAAWAVLRRWYGPYLNVWQDGYPVIEVRPWEELLASLSRKLRKTVRRTIRQAEVDGIRRKIAETTEAERAARGLVALHREAWQGRDIGPEHLTRRFESCIVAAARRMTARGFGGISELRQDGEPIVSNFWICGQNFVGPYVVGASQKALKNYQWSTLYIWDALNIAYDKNCGSLDLLRGEDPYKLRWSTRVIPNHRLILGRRRIAWAPYAGYHVLYSKARRYANSNSAPRWVGNAAKKYRALGRKATRLAGGGR